MPERKATVAALEDLAEQLRTIDGRLARSEEDVGRVREEIIPRVEVRRRRRQTIAVAAVVSLLALAAEHAAFAPCFLVPNQPGSATRSVCGAVFPLYGPAMKRGDERLAEFVKLLEQVPGNVAAREDHERRLDELERRAGIP